VEKSKAMTKEERAALRASTAEAVADMAPETGPEVGRRLVALLVPDPAAQPGRTGLRAGRDVITEVTDTLGKKIRSREKLLAIVEGLWGAGGDEARVAAGLALGRLVPTGSDETEERSVTWIRTLVIGTESETVIDAIADTISREMETGATDPWARAFKGWIAEPDKRLRQVGLFAFTHLLSRGKTPEKLFEALMHARRLAADPDPAVQKAVLALFAVGARRQEAAVRRFVDRLAADERDEVKALAAQALKKLPAAKTVPPDTDES